MPPWNPIVGHLHQAYAITSSLPKDANPNYLPDMIRRRFPDLGPMYYLDLWPFGPQMLVVGSTDGLHQITQSHSLPKYPALKQFLEPIAEGMDLVTMEGDLWKHWRGILNPGFSSSYLMTLISGIVEETDLFCGILQDNARRSRLFRMKDLTDNLTMDVIGRIVLNQQLRSQGQSNPLVDGLRSQVKWCIFGVEASPFVKYNPVRPFIIWYNSRRMNNYLIPRIENRFSEIRKENNDRISGNKSIIDLVLRAYLLDSRKEESTEIESTFKNFTMNQIKLFLFSGHDTTSSTICYLFYILAAEPDILTKIRKEHSAILGSETSQAASIIISEPYRLNQLTYTLAVIKEVLRMFPAVSGTRAGEPGFCVTEEAGHQFPTNGFLIWDDPQLIHRDPRYWPRSDDFIPERWLLPPDDALHPVPGAWRPFSQGPRNCIGQELALLEMRVVLAMTARRFNFTLAYEDLDSEKAPKGVSTVYDERGYQIGRAQPSDNLPCLVTEVNR